MSRRYDILNEGDDKEEAGEGKAALIGEDEADDDDLTSRSKSKGCSV